MSLLSAEDFLRRPSTDGLLDVRAEVEFSAGQIPGSVNIPLLVNRERHEIGICYKEAGQEAAIRLGHEFVKGEVREQRIAAWAGFLSTQEFPVLTCFRGGLRSEITQKWLLERGISAARIEGGYKAMRRVLVKALAQELRGFVVAGLTGSGKTHFVQALLSRTPRSIDLERLAIHRGSAFGGLFQPAPQPAQQTFENALALQLKRSQGRDVLLEDESRLVGRCVLPGAFFESMGRLPRIFLECSFPERVENIVEEYVRNPLRTLPAEQVKRDLLSALAGLKNRLGGLASAEISAIVSSGFAARDAAVAEELHAQWVGRLLTEYYDPLYRHSISRNPRQPLFNGERRECIEWLEANSDLFA